MRFKESPDKQACPVAPGMEDKATHAELRIGNATVFASYGRCEGKASFQGFARRSPWRREAEADRLFAGLSDGGQVQMPLAKTFLVTEVRHGRRSLRHIVDDHGHTVSSETPTCNIF